MEFIEFTALYLTVARFHVCFTLMSIYTCRRCDHSQDTSWLEECPGCGGIYAPKKTGVDSTEQKQRSTFAAAAESKTVYIPTGIEGFDKVIGGGLVAGSPILLGGFRGAGKSTLLCMVADAVAKVKGRALYASSEEGVSGVMSIAHRLGLTNENVEVLGNQLSVEKVIKHAMETKPFLTIFDSLQKFASDISGGSPGSRPQEEAVCSTILAYCRETKRCAIIVSQMSKGGEMKGSTDAAHAVDTVLILAFPKDDDEDAPDEKDVRVLLVDGKNRNGPESGKSYWLMSDTGMLENIPEKSKLINLPRGRYSKRT